MQHLTSVMSMKRAELCASALYGHFDIIFDPYPTHHQLFTALCAPCDMLYLVTMVTGC